MSSETLHTNPGPGPKMMDENIVKALEKLPIRLRQIAKIILCKCRCGERLLDRDRDGILREFIYGHQSRGINHWNWKGGRHKQHGYWLIFRPNHHAASKKGYVREHRIAVEESRNCCLLPWGHVHHRDGNTQNNVWYNLWPMMREQHMSISRPENSIPNDRKCCICNSNKTWTYDGHPKWAVLDGQYACHRCHSREVYRRRNHTDVVKVVRGSDQN
jgi:hypothetical protein